MNDLLAFISARLDEDQALAEGALMNGRSAEWEIDDGGDVQRVDTQGAGNAYVAVGPWDTSVYRGDAAHIVRHDPARVLRDVEAKRKILADYEGTRAITGDDDEYVAGLGLALSALATVWSDHPDYDPALA